jgi:hypothetical protein
MPAGFLLALPGAILPAWGAHRDPPDFNLVGNYFLCLALGLIAAERPARWVIARRGISFLLVLGCGIAAAGLLLLAFSGPPASAWWRAGGLAVVGAGAGMLNSGLLHAAAPRVEQDAAGTLVRAGIWHGLGCLVVTAMAAGSFYAYNVTATLATMAVIPVAYAVAYSRTSFKGSPVARDLPIKQALKDFHSLGAILFASVLFFQFGNEWAIAGWLPLFLIRRVGINPGGALIHLGFYWLFLMAGRLVAITLLPRFRHGRLLLGSVLSALFGCLILFLTKNGFGVVSGSFFLGAGYASIYPLLTEAIGRRFPYYHPGFFNGIFSLALLGALLAPASLGYAASAWGVGVVIAIPLIGSCIVMLLIASIWLEAKVTGR